MIFMQVFAYSEENKEQLEQAALDKEKGYLQLVGEAIGLISEKKPAKKIE